ncbi:MAG: SDR family oxidoreductase [Bacteroidetes bacterium]|nr:SDR family oxidoreductase [Bacteroidota bacterium]
MDLNLKNKVILVTGGARGIGAAIVKVLASEGAVPVIVGKDEDDNLKMLEEIKILSPDSIQIKAELTKPEECASAVKIAAERYGRMDGLVNNAGVNDGIGLEKGTYEEFMLSLHRNVVHYFLMTQGCLPFLKQSGGSIVNITSKVAETGQGNTSAYAAATGGRNALTREWAVELLPFGVRVNAIVVSECYTPLYEYWVNTFPDPQAKLNEITRKIPLGKRMTKPEEIANTAVFLLSDRSSHTTGQLIHVDGGYVHLDRAL